MSMSAGLGVLVDMCVLPGGVTGCRLDGVTIGAAVGGRKADVWSNFPAFGCVRIYWH